MESFDDEGRVEGVERREHGLLEEEKGREGDEQK